MTDVSISLISCNERHYLERLFPSLIPAADLVRAEILLVDNRSKDGSSDYAQTSCPGIHITPNLEKTGYGKNHNLNLKQASGRYFVIMNTDMTVERNIFVALRDYMDQHPDVGMVAPKILNEDGTIQGLNKRYPTLLDLFLRRFTPPSLQFLVKRRLDHYEMRDVGYDHSYEVPFMSGCFMFCRTDLLKSLGGFDEGFFIYFEDVDLCRKVQKTHRTTYYSEVQAVHLWKRTSYKNREYTAHFLRSAYRYFGRWGYQLF